MRVRVTRHRSAATWATGTRSTKPSPRLLKCMPTRPNATMQHFWLLSKRDGYWPKSVYETFAEQEVERGTGSIRLRRSCSKSDSLMRVVTVISSIDETRGRERAIVTLLAHQKACQASRNRIQ